MAEEHSFGRFTQGARDMTIEDITKLSGGVNRGGE